MVLHGQSPVLGTWGVDISNNMSWNKHVTRVAANGKRSLGFIKRNVKIKPPKVWEMAYQTLVCPSWSMLQLFGTPTLRRMPIRLKRSRDAQPGGPQAIMPERLASLHCWTSWTGKHLKRDDKWPVSFTKFWFDFCFTALQHIFYKAVNGFVAVPLPDYIQPTHRISSYCQSMRFHQIHTSKDSYK